MKKKAGFKTKRELALLPELVNLGLSKQEARIYLFLLKSGALDAKQIAVGINCLVPAIYRATKKLESKKLVSVLKTTPLTFQALPPKLALSSFAKKRAVNIEKKGEEISDVLARVSKTAPFSATKIDLIIGRKQIFNISSGMVAKTKKEIALISIGETIPQKLLLEMKKASDRGVKIRMVAHKYDEENIEILRNFIKNGYEIRHYPDWGFHLVVYDSKKSLLIVNNPEDPIERSAMLIYSKGLSKALRDYFYSVWKKATKVH
jgi:sugar-specific transcriptional regulator TrmB